jgi:oligopeptide transport system permease protein
VLTGSLVVERIFGVPGIGREFIESAFSRDYTLVSGTVLLYGTLLVLFNLVVDVVYGFLDPRIRYS